jgi:hypothetical protein
MSECNDKTRILRARRATQLAFAVSGTPPDYSPQTSRNTRTQLPPMILRTSASA